MKPVRVVHLSIRRALMGALLAAFSVAPASATLLMSVVAEVNSGNDFADDNTDDQDPPEKAVHGVAEATEFEGGAFVSSGAAGPCEFAPSPGCAVQIPAGRAVGEIRGDLGRMRARASATGDYDPIEFAGVGDAFSEVSLTLVDALTTSSAGDVSIHLHFDVDIIEADPVDNVLEDLFELRLTLVATGLGSLPEYDFVAPDHQSSHIVIDETFLLPDLPADASIGISLQMLARAECSVNTFIEDHTCAVIIDAGNGASIGVEGDAVSVSGYAYPVPEPASWGSSLSALLALGAVRWSAPRSRLP